MFQFSHLARKLRYSTVRSLLSPVARRIIASSTVPPENGPLLQEASLTPQVRGYARCRTKKKKTCAIPAFAKTPCAKHKTGKKRKKKKKKFVSMWHIKGCEPKDGCAHMLPRFDVMFYRITDKGKRKYQKTWTDCPKLLIKPKKVCAFERIRKSKKKSKRVKRCKKKRPQTACPVMKDTKCLKQHKNKKKSRCPSVKSPCCPPSRKPPKCEIVNSPSDCKKKRTPYPSFSECRRPPKDEDKDMECGCLDKVMMCEVWAEFRRRLAMGLKMDFARKSKKKKK